METLPPEVLVHIFAFLDDTSLLSCEEVCFKWKSAIENENLYAKKCEAILNRHQHQLKSTFDHLQFRSVVKKSAGQSKQFYYKLKKLPSRWKNELNLQPSVYSYFCKTGEVSDEWIRKHNYTGVYDMVWLPDKSYLICSCYDTIQVWNMVDYSRVNVFEGKIQ